MGKASWGWYDTLRFNSDVCRDDIRQVLLVHGAVATHREVDIVVNDLRLAVRQVVRELIEEGHILAALKEEK